MLGARDAIDADVPYTCKPRTVAVNVAENYSTLARHRSTDASPGVPFDPVACYSPCVVLSVAYGPVNTLRTRVGCLAATSELTWQMELVNSATHR